MKVLVLFLLTTSLAALAMTQQCREVTRQVMVCDDDASIRGGKGDKGDVGSNGKAGPPGIKGSKSCNCVPHKLNIKSNNPTGSFYNFAGTASGKTLP